jgi:hypothetical protein
MLPSLRDCCLIFATTSLLSAAAAVRAEDSGGFELEGGGVWLTRNDARIPADTGTEFDLRDLTGSGPAAYFRVGGEWNINDRHGLRVVLAPLEISGTGALAQDTDFVDTTFPAGPTEGKYKFSTYRLTYRYTFHDGEAWRWKVGFTGLIRDAKIELRQGDLQASDDNVGFVPLLHLNGVRRFGERWRFEFDFDGLAGGPGRAIDAALKFTYDLDDHWRLGAGYRTLEGGVDSDETFNFAWLHYGVLTAGYRF